MLVLLSLSAAALTPPISGAVPLPGGVDLTLPFPDGTPVVLSCGYGPGCSAYHSGTNSTGSTNDYYAMDLVRDQAGNGDGLPVVAAWDGTVVYADWATGGWSTFGRMVLVEHDFGDGHTYMTLYAHLSALSVQVGDVLAAKDEVGLMGGSGNYGDNYFSPHLHFSLYRDATFLGGPYGGNAVVPELIDGYEDLAHGDHMTAGPGPSGVATSLTVDEQDPGFALVGPAILHDSGGYLTTFWYEPASGSATTWATWTPDVPETAIYKAQAFIPYSSHATATLAPFTMLAHGEVATTTQDQSIIGGDFHDLFGGRGFKLVAGGEARMELHNGTGETGVDVAFDAIRWVRVADAGTLAEGEACADATECDGTLVCDGTCRPSCADSGCAPGGTCEPATGLCDLWPEDATTTTPTDPDPTDPTEPIDTGTPADEGTDPVSEPTVMAPPDRGCATAPMPGSWLALALLLALRRRTR